MSTLKKTFDSIVRKSNDIVTKGKTTLKNTTRKMKKSSFFQDVMDLEKTILTLPIVKALQTNPKKVYNIFNHYTHSILKDEKKDKTYLFHKDKVEQDILMEYKQQKLLY
jgi:hypothetical protein